MLTQILFQRLTSTMGAEVGEVKNLVDELNVTSEEEDSEKVVANGHGNEAGSSEKKKKKKKKSGNKKKKRTQTEPPTVGLSKIFTSQKYPPGEECNYNLKRTTDEELRAEQREKEMEGIVNDLRKGAEVHRETRYYAQKHIKPGMSMTSIAEMIEGSVQKLAEGKTWLEAGTGFPTGLSVNDCAAHWTPNKGDKTVLKDSDVMKVDFGVHVNGRIIDSAFTMTFDQKYDPLLEAVRAATNTGIKEAGIDARLGEIGGAIQEVMESHEIELEGRTYPIRAIRNLNGHNISQYQIHGGKSVPIVATEDNTKMEEGEVFAIETFGSTGRGLVLNQGEVSHYAKLPGTHPTLRLASARHLLGKIDKVFGTLPFCRRYLDQIGEDKYLLALNQLVKAGAVQDYPPLMDTRGCYTAQYEHTLILRPTAKEVLSRGDDF